MMLASGLFMTANAFNVTISVDMTSYPGSSYDVVKIGGGIVGWSPDYELTKVEGTDVWEITLQKDSGWVDYRFEVAGGTVGWNCEFRDELTAAESTGIGSCFTNPWEGTQTNVHWFELTEDVVLPTVCWESCDACGTSVEPMNITLSVDMQTYPYEFTNVMVNGGFNSWGDALQMVNTSGTIWELTVPMYPGDTDYRFEAWGEAGGWHAEWPDNNATGDCFNGTNMRLISVDGDATVTTVCWESCSACISNAITNEIGSHTLSIYVKAGNNVVVSGLEQNLTTISIYDLQGKPLKSKTVNGENSTNVVIGNDLSTGIYVIKVVNANTVFSKKIAIR